MTYFGPILPWKLEPLSPPYVAYRNIEAYRLQSTYNTLTKPSNFIHSSYDQTMYYKHRIKDNPIHGNLLLNTILEDSLYSRHQQLTTIETSKNSVLGVRHEDQSLIVHVSGKQKDHLIIRNSADFRPYHRRDVKGFQLKLEAEILQIEKFGMGTFNTSTHFLARSLSQIYHLKTTDILDSCDKIPSSHNFVIIEPIQKWICESEIACMSGSKSISNHGIIISTKGELCCIDCNRGLYPWNGNIGTIFSAPYAQSSSVYSQCMNVETTHHSQICYLSKEKVLFYKDFRSPEYAQALFSTPHFITSLHVPSCVSWNVTSPSNQFFVGIQDMMYIMDSRYCKSPLAQRPIPGSPSMMRSLNTSVEELSASDSRSLSSSLTEIMVSSGKHCRQIFGHLYAPNAGSINHESDRAAFLSSCSQGGIDACTGWESVGFPVVDRSGHSHLLGMDIVEMTTSEDKYFLPKYYAGKKIDQNNQMKKNLQLDEEEEGFNESCSENENEKSSMDRMEHLDNQSQSPLLLLCQQSHIGDIYCQRIQLLSKQSPIFSPIQINAPIGVRCTPFPPPVNRNPDANPYLSQTDIYTGFGLGKPILSEDLQLNTFPLTTSNFSDFVTDRELKRFSVLHLKLHELMDEKDILKLQDTHNNNKGIVQELPLIMNIEQLLDQIRPLIPSIRHQLQALSFMTLWELYKFITITLQIKFPIDNLRNILSLSSFGMNDLEFYYLNLPNDTDLFASSDGIRIKQIVNNNFNSKDYFNSYLLCNCHCIHNDDQKINDDDHEINEAYDSFNTFDLYSQQTLSSSPIFTCCDLETCLVPHLIVYKLKYQLWSDISFTESSTTRRTTTKTPSRQQQQQDKGQNSDVTFDVISNLKNIWDEE